ncbi:hypothetical protein V8E51_015585 [Hyaloscypha variabilis]
MAAHGWGHHSYYVSRPRIQLVLHLNFTWGLLWVACITQIRISIACSLLKLSPFRLWKAPLYIIIGVQVLIFTGYYIIIFGCVAPITANWSRVPMTRHWPLKPIEIFTWVVAGLMIGMDLALALMPIILIRTTLTRPTREKILIGALMATGLLATAFACKKATYFHTKGEGDQMINSVDSTFWAKMEQVTGIIAACMPCLKQPAEELLRKIGILGEEHFPGMSRPSFVLSSRLEHGSSVAAQRELAVVGQEHALQDKGGLLHILGEGRELGLGLGLVRTRSTNWTRGTGKTALLKNTSVSMKSPRSDLTPSPLSDMEPKEHEQV